MYLKLIQLKVTIELKIGFHYIIMIDSNLMVMGEALSEGIERGGPDIPKNNPKGPSINA